MVIIKIGERDGFFQDKFMGVKQDQNTHDPISQKRMRPSYTGVWESYI